MPNLLNLALPALIVLRLVDMASALVLWRWRLLSGWLGLRAPHDALQSRRLEDQPSGQHSRAIGRQSCFAVDLGRSLGFRQTCNPLKLHDHMGWVCQRRLGRWAPFL